MGVKYASTQNTKTNQSWLVANPILLTFVFQLDPYTRNGTVTRKQIHTYRMLATVMTVIFVNDDGYLL